MPFHPPCRFVGRAHTAAFIDALCLVTSAAASWLLLAPPFSLPAYVSVTALGVLGTLGVLHYAGAYSTDALRSGRRTLESVVAVMGVAFVIALGVYFLAELPAGTVSAAMHTAAMYFPVLLGGRLAFRGVSKLEIAAQRVLVIGTSELGVAIARAMAKSGSLGAQLVGFLSDDVLDELAIIAGVPVVGKIHELEKQVDAHRIDTIVVATRNRSDHFPAPELLIGKFRGLRIESGVSFYERISGRVWIRDLRPSYLIFSKGFRVCRFSAAVKRLIDIGLSTVGLVIAAPIILLSVIAIRLDSKGSGFYRQERVGKDGEMFTLLKLRSMCTDAEKKSGPVWTRNHDDRVTRVGKYLRMTRVDELPQLWNVLKNDMTLVGPRPERPEFVEKLSERYPYFALRATFKPGITGWAQIWKGYVNEVGEFEEKLALDMYYMKYRSTMMDLRIMWKTAETVLLMRGV